ncbi:hypothetical protein ACIBCT_19900 [Streptosporangium sp. NPDC050855]|uniref:hypothetical protein n=1 Tax=Streptosporangium sp. NPDC050855 TaxID=3366194 RepID=UPI0037B5B674
MRIRMLATTLVTTGALMATLTGAASADGTPDPGDGAVLVTCEGGGAVAVRVKAFTEAEIEEMKKAGKIPAVPALPARPGTGGVTEGRGDDGVVRAVPKPGTMKSQDLRPGDLKPGDPKPVDPKAVPEGADVTVMVRPDKVDKVVDKVEKGRGPERTRVATPEPGEAGPLKKGEHFVLAEAAPVPGEDGVAHGKSETHIALSGDGPLITCATKK